MAQTFRALFQRVDVRPLTDGIAAVFNAEATDNRRYFEVTKVVVRMPGGFGGLTGANALAAKVGLYRTTASSGGSAVTAIKRDTGSASLPAEVTCTEFPTSVTVSGAALRSLADAPSLLFAGTNQWPCARVYGGALSPYQRANSADILRQGGNSNIELVILREGEGVALRLDSYGWPRAGQVNLTVRNMSSGATYQFRSRDIGHPYLTGQAILSLFNGSGSGVVLGVYASEYPNDGEANFPGFRIARIDGVSGGTAVTPIASDSANSAPAALQCVAGDCETRLAGSTQGVPYDWQYTHGALMSVAVQQRGGTLRGITGIDPAYNVGLTPGLQIGQDEKVIYSARAGDGIVLRPNEGVALLAGRGGALETSTFAYCDVAMQILHYPPPASAGTFPAVGDVDSGTVYGPNGNDYTGTLVQPAEADVRSGTTYGAGGTEFTGTLSGGGGGSTWLQRRSR